MAEKGDDSQCLSRTRAGRTESYAARMKTTLLRSLAFAAALAISVPTTVAGVGVGAFAALPTVAAAFPLEPSRLTLIDGARAVELQGMAHLTCLLRGGPGPRRPPKGGGLVVLYGKTVCPSCTTEGGSSSLR